MNLARMLTIALLVAAGLAWTVECAEARSYRRSTPRYSRSVPRPVTGYGANLHRRFVIKQERQRALQGKSVRYHGNILWAR